MEMTVIRSRRRSYSVEVGLKGIIVRAPLTASDRDVREFLEKHKKWLQSHTARVEHSLAAPEEKLTKQQIEALADQALQVIPKRVQYYAPLIGVSYGAITIRNQKTRWGSCSSKGNLNFNCLLMLAPPQVLDSVVVHELCHRKHMNHSSDFYAEVLRVFPEYRRWNNWLKENGTALLSKMI